MSIVIIANHWNHWKTSKRTVWIIILYHISFKTIAGCQLRSPDPQCEIRNWGSVWRTSAWQNSGQKQEGRSFWTQLNSPVVNVIWRQSVTLSHCVTAVKFGVWASVSTRVRQTYVEGMEFICMPCHLCADVGVPVGPSVAACRCTSCVHAVSATHIVLFFPESPGARKPGLGNWRGHPVSIIRANLFSLGGLRLPGHRWGQTVRSSLMLTENARTGWERDVDQGQRDRSLRESWHSDEFVNQVKNADLWC